ncbi:LADA_0H04280g1_1 [Lachancea dasiensis]|uniref:LADA_0H04280g1_1 n=1 Tax=Lachancea dasiensis TaxID=1072105 RepID=A0A1G4K0M5_9SACH|nr:LADA_0H04280g1_1 [Lachancea dasiensis]
MTIPKAWGNMRIVDKIWKCAYRPWDPENHKYLPLQNFVVIALACAFDTMCMAAMVTLNEDLQDKFGVSYTTASWGLTAYAITFAGFIAFLGRVGDVIGNTWLFTCSTLLFSIFSLLCTVMPSFPAFAVFRALQGVAGAGIVPSSFALIPMIFEDSAGTYLSILSMIFAGCFGLGFVLGGAFAMTDGGFRGLFYFVFGSMMVVSVFSFAKVLSIGYEMDHRTTLKERWNKVCELDMVATTVFILSSIMIVIGLTEGGKSWEEAKAYAVFIVGSLLFAGFLFWNIKYELLTSQLSRLKMKRLGQQLQKRSVLIPSSVMGLRNFSPAMLTVFLNYCCFLSSFYIINQYSMYAEKDSPIIASVKLCPIVIGLALGNSVVIFRPQTFSAKIGLIMGFLIMLCSTIILIQLHLVHTLVFWKRLLPSGFLCGLRSGLYFPYMLSMTVGAAPHNLKGLASGIMQTFGQFGKEVAFSVLASIIGNLG